MECKDIPGYPGYKAKDDGTIWTQWVRGKERKCYIGRGLQQLKPARTKDGALQVVLRKDGKAYHMYVSRLILITFIGPPLPGQECCHNDGNPKNNKLENLRWDTRISNVVDKINHGMSNIGTVNGNSKLTEEKVRKIKSLYAKGIDRYNLAKLFNVTRGCIEHVIYNKTWQHVK